MAGLEGGTVAKWVIPRVLSWVATKIGEGSTKGAAELEEIHNIFGDPTKLAKLYIEPHCQTTNPADQDEDTNAERIPISQWVEDFFSRPAGRRDGRNTAFLLADAGMGKTSFLVMLKNNEPGWFKRGANY